MKSQKDHNLGIPSLIRDLVIQLHFPWLKFFGRHGSSHQARGTSYPPTNYISFTNLKGSLKMHEEMLDRFVET